MVDYKERFIKIQIQKSPESEGFLRHLIKTQVITEKTMRNYVIVHQFDEYIKANKGNITYALEDLSDDFKLAERYIRKIHKKYTRIF